MATTSSLRSRLPPIEFSVLPTSNSDLSEMLAPPPSPASVSGDEEQVGAAVGAAVEEEEEESKAMSAMTMDELQAQHIEYLQEFKTELDEIASGTRTLDPNRINGFTNDIIHCVMYLHKATGFDDPLAMASTLARGHMKTLQDTTDLWDDTGFILPTPPLVANIKSYGERFGRVLTVGAGRCLMEAYMRKVDPELTIYPSDPLDTSVGCSSLDPLVSDRRELTAVDAVKVYGRTCGVLLCCAPHERWFPHLVQAINDFLALETEGNEKVVLVACNLGACQLEIQSAFGSRIVGAQMMASAMTTVDWLYVIG